MSDEPFSTSRSQSGGDVDATSTAESTVPAWLAARRARGSTATIAPAAVELEVEFESFSEADTSEPDDAVSEDAVSEDSVAVATPRPVVSSSQNEAQIVSDVDAQHVDAEDFDAQFNLSRPSSPKSTPTRPAPVLFTAAAPVSPPLLPPPLPTAELRPTDAPKPKAATVPPVLSLAGDVSPPEANSVKARFLRWARSATMAGVLVSFLVHAVAVSVLAVLVIGGPKLHRALDIFGVLSDPNDNLSDIELDSAMPFDPGQDAAPLEFPDMVQLASPESSAFDPGDSIRGAVGGKGRGSGEGGEGESMAVPAVNIPKYAVTKGSFSAWTDPRDPIPGISYEIVIQFRLPANVKTYRGSDLSGMVTGTDGYKQAIKFNRGQTFDVKDGSVQVRIRVPGAGQLVRDTIRIESKLLREKQMIEIEF